MKPLRDEMRSPDHDVAHAASLVSAARPGSISADAKVRVRRAVLARLDAGHGRSMWRPSFAAVLLLLAGTAAATSVTWAVVQFVRGSTKPVEVRAPDAPPGASESPARRAPAKWKLPVLAPLPAETPPLAIDPVPATDAPMLVGRDAELPPLGKPPRPAPFATKRTRAKPAQPTAARAGPRLAPTPAAPRDEAPPPVRLAMAQTLPPPPALPPAPRVEAPPKAPQTTAHAPLPVAPAPKLAVTNNPPTTARDDDDVALVHAAFGALRRDRDASAAIRLLDKYLRAYPEGRLAEEALALSFEALAAKGDPRAATRAARYLLQYPDGRFSEAARQARARFAAE